VEHGQADGPEDRIAYGAYGFAVASEARFEDVAAFVAREAVGGDWGEGGSLLEEVFSLRDEVEQGFAFGAGAVWLGEFDFGGACWGFDGFVGGFGGGAAFAAVAWLIFRL
jgi:hypothetical protein